MHKTLNQLNQEISTLGGTIRAALDKLNLGAAEMDAEQLRAARNAIEADQERLQELRATYDLQMKNEGRKIAPKKEDKPMNELKNRLASNEYARAFDSALRNGINRRTARADENYHILLDTLTEAGNSGADGGFLVPIDIDTRIHELMREYGDIAALFGEEAVGTATGWRVADTAVTTGFTKLTGELPTTGIPMDDQPAFAQVPFALDTYGLIIPASNELVNDETADLFGYIANWMAKKLVITRNALVLASLATKNAAAAAGKTDPVKAIKKALNVTLDPAVSKTGLVIAGQTGFSVLDELVGTDGRGLLQPDLTNATMNRIAGRPLHTVTDAQLTNANIVYLGNPKAYGTLFTGQGLEIETTTIGGDAWRKNGTEIRGIVRMDFSVFDADAMCAVDLNK